MKTWIISLTVLLALIAGGTWWSMSPSRDTTSATPTASPTEQLTYEGLYNGPVITTSEKLGSDLDIDAYMSQLNRNGVTKSLIYYGIEGNLFDDAIDIFASDIARYGDRIIPFYSTGIGGSGEGKIAGAKLTGQYQKTYTQAQKKIGAQAFRGIGEVEINDWPIPHNDPKVKELISFAANNNLAVMLHPRREQLDQLSDLIAEYPETTFLIHQFRNDYTSEANKFLDVMTKHPNVVYTIDADHLMFSKQDKIGLLYKYEDQDTNQAVQGFIQDYDRLYDSFVTESIKDYSPLVQAFPDRVTVGTEMSLEYTLDPEVYTRSIKMLRAFIGQLPAEHQEKIAHTNAQRLFGTATQ